MQLNDILEENSIKAISAKTKISEDNLENLLAKNFDRLKKVKVLGFISILEREYNAELSNLREDAQEYYAQVGEDKSITLGLPITEEKKGRSKFFLFFLFLLFTTATWYFLTQFDKKNLSELIPFMDEETLENIMGSDNLPDVAEDLKIIKVSEALKENDSTSSEAISDTTADSSMKSETVTDDESVVVSQSVTDITPKTAETSMETVEEPLKVIVSIVPVNRLWFGLVDMDTKERNHFSISDTYQLEVGDKKWLIATSSAPFTLKAGEKSEEFNDANEHYFKIDKNSATSLTKSEYISLGGWAQW